jgi:hypothetical protein
MRTHKVLADFLTGGLCGLASLPAVSQEWCKWRMLQQ